MNQAKIIILLCCFLVMQACKTGKIELRLKPQHNSRFSLLFNTEGKVSVTVAGKEFNTDLHTGIASELQIDTLANDRYQFSLVYKDYNIQQEIEGKKIDLKNLSSDSSGKMEKGMSLVKGIRFLSVVNKTGKSEALQGTNSILNRLDSNLTGITAETKRQVMSVLAPLVSDDMAKGLLDQCFYVFPSHKVNIGDRWENEIIMQSLFSMVMKNTFTLVEIKDSLALLKVHSDITPGKTDFIMPGLAMAAPKGSDPSPQTGGLDLLGMKMIASFQGTQDGMVWINMKNGMVQKNILNQDLKGKMSISILDLPMTMKMQTGYRVRQLIQFDN